MKYTTGNLHFDRHIHADYKTCIHTFDDQASFVYLLAMKFDKIQNPDIYNIWHLIFRNA